MFQVVILENIKTKRKMKKILLFSITFLMMLCSCEEKKVYRPSQFPKGQTKSNYSFAIPYQEFNGAIYVNVRLNDGPEFKGIWDTGSSLPLKISYLEFLQLIKNNMVSDDDFVDKTQVRVANGQVAEYEIYNIRSISFTDNDGREYRLNNIQAIIDENIETDILIGSPVMKMLGDSYEISHYDNLIYFK